MRHLQNVVTALRRTSRRVLRSAERVTPVLAAEVTWLVILSGGGVAILVFAVLHAFTSSNPIETGLFIPIVSAGILLVASPLVVASFRRLHEVQVDKVAFRFASTLAEKGSNQDALTFVDERLRKVQRSRQGSVPHHRAARLALSDYLAHRDWLLELPAKVGLGFDYVAHHTKGPSSRSPVIGIEIRSGSRFDPAHAAISVAESIRLLETVPVDGNSGPIRCCGVIFMVPPSDAETEALTLRLLEQATGRPVQLVVWDRSMPELHAPGFRSWLEDRKSG